MDKVLLPRPPYRIGFLLIDGFALMSYAAVVEMMRAANLLAGEELFVVRNIPAAGDVAVSSGGQQVPADVMPGAADDLDLVLAVAGGDPFAFDRPEVLRWLQALAGRGVALGGVSGGPVIVARAGLMRGRRMTVHWEHAPALAEAVPDLLLERSLYVIDRDRVTCAGGLAALDMMHAILTERHGASFARQVSDWFLHTEVRPPAGPQRAGLAERFGTTSAPVLLAIELMENHLADPLSLEQLAQLVDLSVRQLNRLFEARLGASTIAFYRDLRLDKARGLLLQAPLSVTEIALATGFANSAHFSRSFRRRYGEAPRDLRRRSETV